MTDFPGIFSAPMVRALIREAEHPGSACEAFERLWCSLHGADSWAANPEVVALTFKVALRNIDAPADAA